MFSPKPEKNSERNQVCVHTESDRVFKGQVGKSQGRDTSGVFPALGGDAVWLRRNERATLPVTIPPASPSHLRLFRFSPLQKKETVLLQ